MIHDAGQIPSVEELDLKAGGVEHTSTGGIKDVWIPTTCSNPIVYVASNVTTNGGALLIDSSSNRWWHDSIK